MTTIKTKKSKVEPAEINVGSLPKGSIWKGYIKEWRLLNRFDPRPKGDKGKRRKKQFRHG